jgi:hypothetical protein
MSEVDLDAMTKEELLAYGQELGISPMNAGMSKGEIRQAIDEHEANGPEAGLQVTTTMTKDYLGVALVNPTPGTSNATDRLGRAVTAGNKDFYGRALVP